MTSNSSLGSCGITMQFDLSRNIDAWLATCRRLLNAARGHYRNLPQTPAGEKSIRPIRQF